MYKISVKGSDEVPEAINWCNDFIQSPWQLSTHWPASGCTFVFDNKKDATWFSLHWAQ